MKSGSRKVIDIRIANIIAPISVPDRNTRSLNSDRSTAGTGAVSSRMTNAASTKTATNAHTAMALRGEPVVAAPLLEHVLQRGEADRHQHDALPVEVLALLGGARRGWRGGCPPARARSASP